jgi:hypothetical protein
MNHSAIFYILRLCGYPDEDIALLIRLYDRTFLFIGNHFGNSAARFLSRGAPQGADPSPCVSNIRFNPLHARARVCARGCSAHASHGLCPNGSSGFADGSSFHNDGPAVIASMQSIIHPAENYLDWSGTRVNRAKSEIAGVDFATGATIATDSIQLNGTPFKATESDQAHKLLGVRISITGDFTSEKEYVMCEMQKRLQA